MIPELLSAITDHMEQGVIATDPAGKVFYRNPAAADLLGESGQDGVGRDSADMPIRFGAERSPLSALIAGLEASTRFGDDAVIESADGPVPIGYSLTRLVKDGEPCGAVLLFHDLRPTLIAEEAERLKRELSVLAEMAADRETPVTARLFDANPIRESMPTVFDQLVERYTLLLDRALEQRAYRVEYDLSNGLRELAERLGQLWAGPRDVIELHSRALAGRRKDVTDQRMSAYVQEGRFLLLELMGDLAARYRRLARPNAADRPPLNKD